MPSQNLYAGAELLTVPILQTNGNETIEEESIRVGYNFNNILQRLSNFYFAAVQPQYGKSHIFSKRLIKVFSKDFRPFVPGYLACQLDDIVSSLFPLIPQLPDVSGYGMTMCITEIFYSQNSHESLKFVGNIPSQAQNRKYPKKLTPAQQVALYTLMQDTDLVLNELMVYAERRSKTKKMFKEFKKTFERYKKMLSNIRMCV